MDRLDRAALNRFNERPALVVIEPRPGAGSFAVKQPIRAAIIEANHPVAHDLQAHIADPRRRSPASTIVNLGQGQERSEEHTSELQSLMRLSYAVFCLKKKKHTKHTKTT